MTTLVARPDDPGPTNGHKKGLGSHRGPTTQKGGTAMKSASVAHRPVDAPPKSAPKKGAWAVGHESDERIAIIQETLNLVDGSSPRSATDDAIRKRVATCGPTCCHGLAGPMPLRTRSPATVRWQPRRPWRHVTGAGSATSIAS